MTTDNESVLLLRIIIQKPVVGILYGLQKGSGKPYETVQKQQAEAGDLVFDLTLPVGLNKDGHPSVAGPYVQGPPAGRFVYIDIGNYAGQQQAQHSGRLKVPLPNLTATGIEPMVQDRRYVARVPGTTLKDGRPTMGTATLVGGWVVEDTV